MSKRLSVAAALVLLVMACTADGDAVTSTSPGESTSLAGDIPSPPPHPPIINVLRVPLEATEARVGLPVAFSSHLFAEAAVTRLELWVDDNQVEVHEPEDPQTELVHRWDWAPAEAGLKFVLVKATDAAGREAYSLPRWVRIGENTEIEASLSPRGAGLGLGRAIAAFRNPGASFQLSTDDANCTAEVEIGQSDSDGIAVYLAGFGSTGFDQIELLPPSGGLMSLPLGPGPQVLYWQTYQGGSAHLGPPVMVPPNPCAQGTWVGEVELHDGILTTSASADEAYLYLTSDDANWARVPGGGQTTVLAGPMGSTSPVCFPSSAPTASCQ